MEAYDLYQEIQHKQRQLEASVKNLRKAGSEKAKAEQEYQMLKYKEFMQMLDQGMSATSAKELIRGLPSVAKARFERDMAAVVYDANIEAVNSIKLQMRILDNQIQREWGTPTAL